MKTGKERGISAAQRTAARRRPMNIAIILALAIPLGGYGFQSGGVPKRTAPIWLTAQPIAHKGLWEAGGVRPENSLAAFEAAAAAGVPIELDVQLSRDGKVVVFHDYTLRRMTGRPGKVAGLRLAELQRTRLDGGAETIPTLEQTLKLVHGRVPLFVEIKNKGEAGRLEDSVAALLGNYDGQAAVMSFNPYSLARVARTAPELPRGQLSGSFRGENLAWYKVFILRGLMMNRISKPDFVAYEISELPNLATRAQRLHGRPLLGWTAETQQERIRAGRYCDQVICDAPALP